MDFKKALDKLPRLDLPNGPNRIAASKPLIWERKQIQFPKSCSLEYQMTVGVQEPNNPECYAPSSELFKID
jgi:hypothetical protein